MPLKQTASLTPADFRKQYRLIHDIYVLLDDGDRRVLGSFGLTTSEYAVLMLLEGENEQRLTTLSERLLKAKSTVTRIVDHLEEAGLVARADDPHDRRAQRVTLTPRGRAYQARAHAAHVDSLSQRMAVLTTSEQEQLQALLQKLRTGLRALLNGG